MITYKIKKEKQKITEKYSFGVVGYDNMSGKEICSALDITQDETAVQNFVALCNQLNLSVCHFEDAIEDFLVTLSGLE